MFDTIIDSHTLHANLDSPQWILFDCRFRLGDPNAGYAAYKQGHIPGAHYLHLDHDLSTPPSPTSGRHPLPDPQQFISTLRAVGFDNQSQAICYDDMGGAFAARLWWLLQWLGHNRVAVLDGALDGWKSHSYPLSTEVSKQTPGTFSGEPNATMWVNAQTVREGLATNTNTQATVLDARSTARFTGEDNATDPVVGHIPGAISAAFADNLNAQGHFKSPTQLRARYEQFIDEHQETIVMCGSGVTACHDLLAMRIAGLPMAQLYVGSWSEWIRDPTRPVTTGT